MRQIASFAATVVALSAVTAMMEFLLPSGSIKNTASTAAGLVFLSAMCEQIIGIFTQMGV